jgi:hypothetical protein
VVSAGTGAPWRCSACPGRCGHWSGGR